MLSELMQTKLEALQQEVISSDFSGFLQQSVETLNPSAAYLPNWHLELIGAYLEAVETGAIQRLMINLPPRYLKSLCVSVAWPAWLLGHNPTRRIIVGSYAQQLSLKHSLDCRLLMAEKWYRHAYPQTEILSGQNEKHKFMTTAYGFRLAVSVGGTLTGEGGDLLILDDPLSPHQAESLVFRNLCNRWFENTFSSRLNDKRKGAIVLVMQRLHRQDLCGYLQGKNGWEVLNLPAIAEQTRHYLLPRYDYRYLAGECLHPLREDAAMLARMKHEMGSRAFAAQYQQQPQEAVGGMVKPEWFGRYTALPIESGVLVQSWDTAFKANAANDCSVCITVLLSGGVSYVREVLCERLEYPQLRRKMIEQAEKWKPQAILVEDKASGQSLLQDLRQATSLPVIARRPVLDKLSRFASVTPLIEAGRVSLPTQASWLAEFEQEILGFPNALHDDQVDALSQYLSWLQDREKMGELRIRRI